MTKALGNLGRLVETNSKIDPRWVPCKYCTRILQKFDSIPMSYDGGVLTVRKGHGDGKSKENHMAGIRTIMNSPVGLKWIAVGVLPLVVGCDRQEVRAYRVPRVSSRTPMMTPPAPGQVAQSDQARTEQRVIWDVPPDWKLDPAPRQFRVATFVAQPGDVEISVAAFAGAAGGLVANVNRWRGQIQLPPVSESEIEGTLETQADANHAIRVLDITNGQRLLAAIVQPGDGQTWFVKAQGDAALVGGVRDTLIQFALSLRLNSQTGSQASASESSPLPAGTSVAASSIENAIMQWTPPTGWSREEQPSQMVAAVWTTQSGCRVTLTPLRGPGAELLPSVNMWRTQLGLTQVQDPSQVELTQISPSASLFDERTADGSLRILVATITKPDRTWFLKLTGTDEAAESELPHLSALAELIDAAEDDTP